MTIEQLITQKVQQLPSNLKQEVLNFVEFLEAKKEIASQEEMIPSDEEKGWEVFLNLEKDAVGSQHSDISDNHDSYLYSKE
jgi:hypothetical protein